MTNIQQIKNWNSTAVYAEKRAKSKDYLYEMNLEISFWHRLKPCLTQWSLERAYSLRKLNININDNDQW